MIFSNTGVPLFLFTGIDKLNYQKTGYEAPPVQGFYKLVASHVSDVGMGPTRLEAQALIIDGVIGYSLRGAPRGGAADLIRWANAQQAPILVLDVPSGVEATTGAIFDPAIKAKATMTLALPKQGFRVPGIDAQVGELYLADISVPPALYAKPALAVQVGPIFVEQDIIRLRYPS